MVYFSIYSLYSQICLKLAILTPFISSICDTAIMAKPYILQKPLFHCFSKFVITIFSFPHTSSTQLQNYTNENDWIDVNQNTFKRSFSLQLNSNAEKIFSALFGEITKCNSLIDKYTKVQQKSKRIILDSFCPSTVQWNYFWRQINPMSSPSVQSKL